MLTIEEIRTAFARSEPVQLADPVLARFSMPLREVFYPLGFPLQIETNSEEVLNSAAVSWQGFTKLFDTPPIKLRVGVTGGSGSECPPTPTCRVQQHLATNIADQENFSVVDLSRSSGQIWLTEAAVSHRGYLRYFFLESAAMAILATSYTTAIHAACIEYKGCGILLCGDSGAGKTSLSYACARAGWTYITDDASFLVNNRTDRLIVGNCNQARFRPSAVELFSELAGKQVVQRAQVGKPSIELTLQPLRHISAAFTSRINYVVYLNRRTSPHQELLSFPIEVARLSMEQTLFSLPATRLTQCVMIDHLLDDGALELRYTKLDWAVDRLARLAERGH
ncbi:aldolase [Occallatibacter savannae]|uniref:aldolase n=1 Tax=Occallatibacter savannae TaxID=1002691 RepID=UPI000D69242E|nr:aldolase [Occallatibacter savannae]